MKNASLFLKFTLMIIIAAVLIVFITHAALMINFRRLHKSEYYYESFRHHAELIVARLQVNDTTATRSFIDTIGINVRWVNSKGTWASSEQVPTLRVVKKIADGKQVFWYRRQMIAVIEKDNVTFIIQGINPFKQFRFPWDIFIVWLVVVIQLFGFVHLKIRYWLKPVKAMKAGVKKISNGDFDIQLPETMNDELGQLVHSFNVMAMKIRNDIKSRDQLLRDISHELRSPLSRMRLALEFLPEGATRQTLKNNIGQLDKMTVSILEEERLDSPFGIIKREPIAIGELVHDIVTCRSQYSIPIQIETITDININADKERLRMALENIVDNAIKYSSVDDGCVTIAWASENGEVMITIKDNGIGIPDADIPFVFEPFYRVDKARGQKVSGYGLGMSLTKKIVKAHGGSISLTSTTNVGTTVKIRIPVTESIETD